MNPFLSGLAICDCEPKAQTYIYFVSAYMERSPYEISIPSYGINVKTSDEGSVWYAGHQVRKCEELPVLFTIGMTGCAFSILLNSFLADGGEVCKNYAKFVGKLENLKRLASKYVRSNWTNCSQQLATAATFFRSYKMC